MTYTATRQALNLIDLPETGLTVGEASQGNPANCSHYTVENLWRHGTRVLRTTVTVHNDQLRYGPGTSARVEVWHNVSGWVKVWTLDETHDAFLDVALPPVVYRDHAEANTTDAVETALLNIARQIVAQ